MKILIIDIETTGFLDQGGKICEVGIVELNLQTGDKKIIFDEVCHERPITLEEVENSWIVQNGYMTTDEIRHSPQFKNIKPRIQEIVNSYPAGATAYNNAFDFGFLESRGIEFVKKLPCPMKLSTNVCRIPSRNGYSGYKWPNVEEAFNHFFPDNDYDEIHRGADDAFHEADIVKVLFDKGIFKV